MSTSVENKANVQDRVLLDDLSGRSIADMISADGNLVLSRSFAKTLRDLDDDPNRVPVSAFGSFV